MMLIDLIASDNVLDAAYEWMCEKRAHHHLNSDVWQVRRWWEEKKPLLQQQLRAGTYRFRELGLFWGYLRKAIKAVNEVMNELRVEKHPDKTFIGRFALRHILNTGGDG